MRRFTANLRRIHGLALSGGIGGLVAVQLVGSLLVQLLVLRIVGAGASTDAFIAAQTMPLVATSIVGTALQNIWQPRLAIADEDWRAELERALAMTISIVLPVTIVLLAITPFSMNWFFVGFTSEQAELTGALTQINLIAMTFNIAALIIAAGGRARARFFLVESVPAAMSLLTLVGITIAVPHSGVRGATWVLALRAVASFALLWLALGRPMPRDPRDSRLKATARATFALMGGSSFYKLGPLVDRFWGSQAPSGQMTLFNLAQTGMGALASLVERAVALPVIPALSRALKAEDYALVRRLYRRTLFSIWAVVGATVIGGIIASAPLKPWIVTLLQTGSDQASFLIYTVLALTGFLGVAAAGNVINSAFYAMGDVQTPISVGTAGFFLGLIIKSAAFLTSGLLAMAVGTSMYYIVTAVVMVIILERRLTRYENASS